MLAVLIHSSAYEDTIYVMIFVRNVFCYK